MAVPVYCPLGAQICRNDPAPTGPMLPPKYPSLKAGTQPHPGDDEGSVAQVRGARKAAGELYCPLDVTNTYTSTFYSIDMLGKSPVAMGGIAKNSPYAPTSFRLYSRPPRAKPMICTGRACPCPDLPRADGGIAENRRIVILGDILAMFRARMRQ